MENPTGLVGGAADKFEYTAIAQNKVTTYQITYADLFKIPQKIRD